MVWETERRRKVEGVLVHGSRQNKQESLTKIVIVVPDKTMKVVPDKKNNGSCPRQTKNTVVPDKHQQYSWQQNNSNPWQKTIVVPDKKQVVVPDKKTIVVPDKKTKSSP